MKKWLEQSLVPHIFKQSILSIVNSKLLQAIDSVRRVSSKERALRRAFRLITDRYTGYRFHTLPFWKAYEGGPNILWKQTGFMHCTQQNFLLRVLLVKSGWFSEKDISLGYSLIWYFSPHQYLIIKMNDGYLAVDPWNYRFGANVGKFAFGFGMRNLDKRG